MECDYLMQLVGHVRETGKHWATGCRSGYLDDRGISFVWPSAFGRFTDEMSKPRVEDYTIG